MCRRARISSVDVGAGLGEISAAERGFDGIPRTAVTAIPLAGIRLFLRRASGWLELAQFSWVSLVVDMSLGRACTLGAMTHLTWTLAVNRVAVAVPGGRVFRV